jgi:hypothetical protein
MIRVVLIILSLALTSNWMYATKRAHSIQHGTFRPIPLPFQQIDFANRTYRSSLWKGPIRLKDGAVEIPYEKIGGDSFDLEDVYFADLNGDGIDEAIVPLFWLECGISCDAGSYLFFIYSMRNGRLRLLQELSTTSLAYECGLKSFTLNGKQLTVEVFKTCKYTGSSFKPTDNSYRDDWKFFSHKFSRFTFAFTGNKFVLKKREFFPNPEPHVLNYHAQVAISRN